MRLNIVNPNTSATMTATIAAAAHGCAAANTTIVARTARAGPASIEGHYDEAVATLALLDEVREGERDGCAAHIIACFGDPGLLAAREIARAPVIGIAEAAMHCAALVATGFSIVTTLPRTRGIAEHLALVYGFERTCRRVRAIDVAVLDLDDPAAKVGERLLHECRRALDEDGSGAIVLGCAGMAGLARDLSASLGAPVVEGVAAAVKLAEALVGLGLSTSKHGDLAYPLAKPYRGFLAGFAP